MNLLNFKNIFLGILILIFLNACSQKLSSQEVRSLSTDLSTGLTCENARSKMFDAYYKVLEENSNLQNTSELGKKLESLESHPRFIQSLTLSKQKKYVKAIVQLNNLVISSLDKFQQKSFLKLKLNNEEPIEANEVEPLFHLLRLEMRSKADPEYDQMNVQIDLALKETIEAARQAEVPCEQNQIDNSSNSNSKSFNHPLYGAHLTMATAYQSCDVLNLPPMTRRDPKTEGVRNGKKNPNSGGYSREYTDTELLMRTHFYYRHQNNLANNCVDQRAKPLVYDYGGKPDTKTGIWNMFMNSGSGGSALGIDCSGFISTSLAAAGNRFNPEMNNKPITKLYGSSNFIDPVKENWTCYKSAVITYDNTLQPGDIGAVVGHVVMVDKVQKDPFGLSFVTKVSQCESLKTDQFNFIIIQSSPEQNSVGINRYEAKEYLSSPGKMKTLFLAYAKAACLSKFDGVARKPNTSIYGIIRHKQTSECLTDRALLTRQSCVQNCQNLN